MITLKFYNKGIFESILSGAKWLETRALNPEEPQRYFGDIKPGDQLKFLYVPDNKEIAVEVLGVMIYSNLYRFVRSVYTKGIFPYHDAITDPSELVELYNKLSAGYFNKIVENGLIVIDFKIVEE